MKRMYFEYKQQDLDIYFNTAIVNNSKKKKTLEVKFKIVFQTGSTVIEKYCKQNYETLLTHKQYSTDEKTKLFEMKKYIKDNLNVNDLNYIHKYFFDKGWFNPFKFNKNFIKIDITDTDAKMWTDKELPYLEIDGLLTLDLKKMFDEYMLYNFHKFEFDIKQPITSRTIKFKFARSLPLFLTYKINPQIYSIFVNIFESYIKSKSKNIIKNEIEKLLKISNIETYKMNINWKFSDTIEVNINDTIKLLKLKAKESFLPTVGGFVLYDMLRKK